MHPSCQRPSRRATRCQQAVSVHADLVVASLRQVPHPAGGEGGAKHKARCWRI
jgi:hypothetical protein